MKSLQLFRTSSGNFNHVQNPQKQPSSSPRTTSSFSMRRSLSESDMTIVRSELKTTGKLGSRSFSVQKIPEEYCSGERVEEDFAALSGGGTKKHGGGGGGGGSGNHGGSNHHPHHHGFYEIGDYYREMIKGDPMNPLLLGNYAKYLHKVKKDFVKAEEYYSRAILASPGDGQVLSLYGTLIWETQRDQNRASFYFHQAIQASPNDCMVLGSYANFLWESEDADDDREIERDDTNATMVEVF